MYFFLFYIYIHVEFLVYDRKVVSRVHYFKALSVLSRTLVGLSIHTSRLEKGLAKVELVADFFSAADSRGNCLFSYLSLAVNQEER